MRTLRIISAMLIIVISSTTTFAYGTSCITHAQCQDSVEESTGCFLVKNNDDSKKCSVKCYRVFVGSYCSITDGKSHGECKVEDYKNPEINEKECKGAIPSSLVEDMFEV